MKFLKVFIAVKLLLLRVLISVQCSNNKNLALLSGAINDVFKSFYLTNRELLMINFNKDSTIGSSLHPKSVKTNIFPLKVIDVPRSIQRDRFELNQSAILTFDSVIDLKNFNSQVQLTNRFHKAFQFFVHCQKCTSSDIATLSETTILQFQYFLIEDEDYIRLMTIVWYTPEKCRAQQLIEVNKFLKMEMKWETDAFVIKKFRNFHNCFFVIGIPMNNPASFYHIDKRTNEVEYGGYYIGAIDAVSKPLNVRFVFNPVIETDDESSIVGFFKS